MSVALAEVQPAVPQHRPLYFLIKRMNLPKRATEREDKTKRAKIFHLLVQSAQGHDSHTGAKAEAGKEELHWGLSVDSGRGRGSSSVSF